MNNSKKIIKNHGIKDKKKNKKVLKKQRLKELLYAGIAIMVIVVAVVCYEQLKPKLLLTVNDTKLYETDLMYDIYTQEKTGESMSSIYQQIYGKDYWNAQVDEAGNNGTVVAKNAAMQTAEQREVLYQEAKEMEYELTEEEKTSVAEQVKQLREEMTDKQKRIKGLDEKTLTDVLSKDVLAARYKQELIDDYEIDDAKIAEGISKKDYRQYDLQYYYVSTKKTDDSGESTDLPTEEKNKLKEEMKGILTKARKEKDFTKLVEENNESGIQYNTKALIETDTDFISEKQCKEIKKMKNGIITDLLEGDDGYYIVRMENNNSSEAYDNAVKEAIEAEETTQFNSEYASLTEENYEIIKNTTQWNGIKMGTVTI